MQSLSRSASDSPQGVICLSDNPAKFPVIFPVNNPIQTEIFRCRANRAVPAGFLCGRFVSADGRPNVTAFFAAVVSAPQNRVSRKRRPTVAETSSNGRQLNVPLLRSKYFSETAALYESNFPHRRCLRAGRLIAPRDDLVLLWAQMATSGRHRFPQL